MKFAAALALAIGTDARMWFGGCPAVPKVDSLDSARFAGPWYEIERDAIFPMEMGQECETQNYRLNDQGTLDLYFRAEIMWNYGGIGGTMDCNNASQEGTCKATMKPEGKEPIEGDGTIDILATDYENWQVMYVCGEMLWGAGNMQWVLISSRQPTLSDEHLAEAYAAIENSLPGFALGWPWMHYTRQGESCNYDWNKW